MENVFTDRGHFTVRLDSVSSIGAGKAILQALARPMRIADKSAKADRMKRKFIFGTFLQRNSMEIPYHSLPHFSAAGCRRKRAGSPFHPFSKHSLRVVKEITCRIAVCCS